VCVARGARQAGACQLAFAWPRKPPISQLPDKILKISFVTFLALK